MVSAAKPIFTRSMKLTIVRMIMKGNNRRVTLPTTTDSMSTLAICIGAFLPHKSFSIFLFLKFCRPNRATKRSRKITPRLQEPSNIDRAVNVRPSEHRVCRVERKTESTRRKFPAARYPGTVAGGVKLAPMTWSGRFFRFGGHPAAVPSASIAATCSADRSSVYAGSGDFVGVRADTSNPDNRPLNYSWSASEGTVDGTGPEVRWSSADRRPGTYTIQVRVDNGRNGTADCSANVRVEVRPNRPPTMSCSTSQTVVTVGEPIEVAATASDPDDDPLSFSWQASGGRMEGSGSTVRFRTGGLAPGSYTIMGQVNDGRDGTADCTESVEVRAAQKPAEVQELEKRLALHSVYFATAKPTAADPTGGLLESQQTVLLALANDFNRYLTFNPQAHLIFEGHADMRGTIEY